jgi:hypothetical protein
MGNPGKSRITVVVVLAIAAAACHRREDSKQLAALDSALKSGVITKSEYDAKKSALAQLAALDKARDAGLLTPAEYQERKQKLLEVVPLPIVAEETPSTAAAASRAVTPVAAAAGGVRQEHIFDPHLNLNAYDVTVPANWKFDGIYVPGSSCVQIPFPVFRMYSPDGLTEIRRLPRFDWSWTTSKFKGQQAVRLPGSEAGHVRAGIPQIPHRHDAGRLRPRLPHPAGGDRRAAKGFRANQ